MQYLWIGNLEEKSEYQRKVSFGYSNNSAQIAQENILLGIEKRTTWIFDSINGSVVKGYPKYGEKNVPEVQWHHNPDANDISVGFGNYKYLNRLLCRKSMVYAAKKWIEERFVHNGLTIIVYSLRSGPLATAVYIKKRIPAARIFVIVTDLPQYMDLSENFIKKLLKRIDWVDIHFLLKNVTGYVLYADKMAEFLRIDKSNYILMEGCMNFQDLNISRNLTPCKSESPYFSFFYSGKLEKQYGIDIMIKAFLEIPDRNLRLIITGEGSYSSEIFKIASKDSRIDFRGFLPKHEDVLKLQNDSSCLMNMRLPSQENSKYSFPSKILEYMYAGKPIISFNLDGIPSEYKQYLFLVKDESMESLKKTMIEVSLTKPDELSTIGLNERDFVTYFKNSDYQAKRIVEFINKHE